jgi:hypothetical protein
MLAACSGSGRQPPTRRGRLALALAVTVLAGLLACTVQADFRQPPALDAAPHQERPLSGQHLHVLIVGVNVRDGTALKMRILESLGAKMDTVPPGNRGAFTHPKFSRAVLYGVLIYDVDRSKFELALAEVGREIERLRKQAGDGQANDVVLVYYPGEDWVDPDTGERYLLTARNHQFPAVPKPTFAVPLTRSLPKRSGVVTLVLYVPEAVPATERDPGLLRFLTPP